jgi:selenophosphate synthase
MRGVKTCVVAGMNGAMGGPATTAEAGTDVLGVHAGARIAVTRPVGVGTTVEGVQAGAVTNWVGRTVAEKTCAVEEMTAG